MQEMVARVASNTEAREGKDNGQGDVEPLRFGGRVETGPEETSEDDEGKRRDFRGHLEGLPKDVRRIVKPLCDWEVQEEADEEKGAYEAVDDKALHEIDSWFHGEMIQQRGRRKKRRLGWCRNASLALISGRR